MTIQVYKHKTVLQNKSENNLIKNTQTHLTTI
jgi:hypothetical protein